MGYISNHNFSSSDGGRDDETKEEEMDESGVDLDWSVGDRVSFIFIFTAKIMKVVLN